MGIEKTHGRNYDLTRLLSGIEEGKIVLPEFQRDFLWDTTAVKQLLATCLTGWPIGSLLLLPGSSKIFFNVRPIESAPPIKEPFQMVILDGQQRLTSLYQALYGRGPFRYAIRLDLIDAHKTIEELEEAITSIPISRWNQKYNDPAREYADNLLPTSALRSATEFYAWRDAALGGNGDLSKVMKLTRLYVEFLSGLDRYEIPAVVIDNEVHPEAVARIFERVNRLGQALGTFDLMVAKSYSTDFNLRDKWDEAQEQRPQLAFFLGGDGMPILNVIALRTRKSVRQHDVLELPGTTVRDYWDNAVAATDHAIGFVRNSLGVWLPDWMPYRVHLTILAGLSFEMDLYSKKDMLRSWFWKSIFQGRYDVASNTRAVEDFDKLAIGHDPLPSTVTLERETLLSVTKRQYGALHRGLLCLLASSGPLDPISGSSISPVDQVAPTEVVPISLLNERSVYAEGEHLLTLGMVLARGGSSRSKSKILLDQLDDSVRASQLLPLHTYMVISAYDLLTARLGRVAGKLEEYTGASVVIVDSQEPERTF